MATSAADPVRRLQDFLHSSPLGVKLERFRRDRAFLQGDAVLPAFDILTQRHSGDAYTNRFLRANRELVGVFRDSGLRAVEERLARLTAAGREIVHLESDPRRGLKALNGMLELMEIDWAPEPWCKTALGIASTELSSGAARLDGSERTIVLLSDALDVAARHQLTAEQAEASHNLAVTLVSRPGATAADFEAAVTLVRRAIALYEQAGFPDNGEGDTRWGEANSRMSLAFVVRDRPGGDAEENIREALDSLERAERVVNATEFPVLYAQLMNHVGLCYQKKTSGDPAANREEAIRRFELALRTYPPGAPPAEPAGVHINLSFAYLNRQLGDKRDNVEKAIQYAEAALRVYTRERSPWQWAKAQNNLGLAYCERIAGSRSDNIERGIRHLGNALEVRTREASPLDWARGKWNLSRAWPQRIEGSLAENVEAGIRAAEEALTVYSREKTPLEWAQVNVNLANCYLSRVSGEKADNVEQARARLEAASEVVLKERTPELWAGIRHLLGIAYRDRLHGSAAENIESALGFYLAALEVRTRDRYPVDWASTSNNLGLLYRHRVAGDRNANLEEARRRLEAAQSVYTRKAWPLQWANTQRNLSNIWAERTDGDRYANQMNAAAHLHAALEALTPEQDPMEWAGCHNNLGYIYAHLPGGDTGRNRTLARQHYEQALSAQVDPYRRRQTLRNAANLEFAAGDWAKALEGYRAAIDLGDALLGTAYTETGRRAEIGETSYLHARAAYCLFRLACNEEALVLLERGKARFLTEFLLSRQESFDDLPEPVRSRAIAQRSQLEQLNNELRLPRSTPGRRSDEQLGAAILAAQTALKSLLGDDGAEGKTGLAGGGNLAEILSAAAPGEIAAAPIVTPAGSVVFVLPHGVETIGADHILMLEGFDSGEFLHNDRATGWIDGYLHRATDLAGWLDTIERSTRELWQRLMGPLAARLQQLGASDGTEVILVPQGGLGLLPLEAAWQEENGARRYFVDDHTVRFAPSFRALRAARERAAGRRAAEPGLFGVFDPTGDLPYAAEEAHAVARHFDAARRIVLTGPEGQLQAVRGAARNRSHVHFACHGEYDWQFPLGSGLRLADGVLTLAEILSWRLTDVRLVALSACETGITDTFQAPDEYFGLPLAWLAAEVPGVVATLWAVDDRCAALLMNEMYRGLMEGLSPAAALRRAQQYLQDLTARELGEHFKSFLRMSAEQAQDALFRLQLDFAPEDRPYAHPYYWAAFTLVGC